ncbi:hypothetical protein [Paenibacillus oryzisoli]|nr:hypothetical protein [Paenibacillus oryzisoli]
MQQTEIHEIEKLFRILQNHRVHCSLELKVEEESDPLLSIVRASVSVDYFQGIDENFLLVELNNGTDFSFSESKSTFHKYVSDCQFDICISSDKFSAFFSSGELSEQAVLEARD